MKRTAGAFIFYIVLSALGTWPLALKIFDHLPGDGDNFVGTFIINHNIRKLVSLDFSNYFDAPFFHPLKNTLAFSEHLFTQSLLGLPAFVLTRNPIFTYNFVYFLTFLLSGFFMYLLSYHLTGSWLGSLVAGMVYAFFPLRLADSRITVLSSQFFPLVFLCLDKFLTRPSWANLLGLLIFFLLQSLASWYYTVVLSVGMLVFVLSMVVLKKVQFVDFFSKKMGIKGLLFIVVALIIIFPFATPYFEVKRDYKVSVSSGRVYKHSVHPGAFLTTGQDNLLYGDHSKTFLEAHKANLKRERKEAKKTGSRPRLKAGYALFPGFTAILLAGIGLGGLVHGALKGLKKACLASLIVVSVVGLILSFGPYMFWGDKKVWLPYYLLHQLSFFQFLRDTFRFIILPFLCLSLLTGMGTEVLLVQKDKILKLLILGFLFALLPVEYTSVPISLDKVKIDNRELYQWLKDQPGDLVVLEHPNGRGRGRDTSYDARYDLAATFHHKRIVNGYSGFIPQSYYDYMLKISKDFPSRDTIELIKRLEVDLIIVHERELNRFEKENLKRLEQFSSQLKLEKATSGGFILRVI